MEDVLSWAICEQNILASFTRRFFLGYCIDFSKQQQQQTKQRNTITTWFKNIKSFFVLQSWKKAGLIFFDKSYFVRPTLKYTLYLYPTIKSL